MNWLFIKIAIFIAVLNIWNHHIQEVKADPACPNRVLDQVIDDAGETWTCPDENLEAWICEDDNGEAWTCDGDDSP